MQHTSMSQESNGVLVALDIGGIACAQMKHRRVWIGSSEVECKDSDQLSD
jgi:hypothetical protein